mmetsp:Transcript_92727/g.271463  ORF Transcript_92727/g.271463 Transcript_92727/m.271463 type:complete len:261 (+) Transcript_92727:187-969(+)
MVLLRQGPEVRGGRVHVAAVDGADLDKGACGVNERLLAAGKDLDRLADARQLLRAQARALAPLQGLGLAGRLGIREEGLVRLELGRGVVLELAGVGQLLGLVGLVQGLLVEGELQRLHLRALRRHELLPGLLSLRLLGVGLRPLEPLLQALHALHLQALSLGALRRLHGDTLPLLQLRPPALEVLAALALFLQLACEGPDLTLRLLEFLLLLDVLCLAEALPRLLQLRRPGALGGEVARPGLSCNLCTSYSSFQLLTSFL